LTSFRIITFGCKVNQCDSQIIRETLASWGLGEAYAGENISDAENEKCDLIVVNTCTVTGTADSKFRKTLRRVSRENPDAIVAVTGCFANRAACSAEEVSGADMVFKMGDFAAFAGFLGARGLVPMDVEPAASSQSYFAEHTRAFLKIQDGCDCFCAYCIVPHVRPKLQSENPDALVAAINNLSDKGYREVVLTGIHLGFYGRDLGRIDLPGLLHRIDAECDVGRIRLSSIEINEVSDDILELIAGSEKFCRHLHLPLQSGSDEILGEMGRRYDSDFFIRRVKEIREGIADIGLTTDIIVGFPGETDDEFERTTQLVQEIGFAKIHVFRFSPRPGTKAAEMGPRVPQGTISARARRLMALGDEVACEFRERFVGQTLEVLGESGGIDGSSCTGFSSNYIRVMVLDAPNGAVGSIIPVRLTDAGGRSGIAEGRAV
jgi:threonylcarbamoyladenosine tRNA methylthiotransferase MtaB